MIRQIAEIVNIDSSAAPLRKRSEKRAKKLDKYGGF